MKVNNFVKTERLNIAPLSADEMLKYMVLPQNEEYKDAYEEMLELSLKYPDEKLWYCIWAIRLNEEDKTIGDLCFKGVKSDGSVEIGYGIYPEFQNKGYMTEAVNAMTKWALNQNGVKNVEAEAEEGNSASIRVLEKCHFVRNGVMGEEGPRFVYQGDENK